MHKLNQRGVFNVFIIPTVILGLGLIVSLVICLKFYNNYIDARDNYQPKIDTAVAQAKETQKAASEDEFTQREKLPFNTYNSPTQSGSVKLVFPKTWSSYVVVSDKNDTVDYYAHPNYVPSTGVNYALRMSVVDRDFANELRQYDSQVKKGDLQATSVQVSGVKGTRLDGFLSKDKEGSMVIFPLRDKTLRVWTESKDFRDDFNNIVLANLSFVP